MCFRELLGERCCSFCFGESFTNLKRCRGGEGKRGREREEEKRESRRRLTLRAHLHLLLTPSRPISIAILAPIYTHKSMSAEDGHLWAAEVRPRPFCSVILFRSTLTFSFSPPPSFLDLQIRLHFRHRSLPKLPRRPSSPRSSVELHGRSTGSVGSSFGGRGDAGREDSSDYWSLIGAHSVRYVRVVDRHKLG